MIIPIDLLHLGRPHVIAAHLLLGEAPLIVDPGPTSTLATLEAGLAAQGLAVSDLHAILLTHIHLDHAAATGALVARNPNLRVFVHQRGAAHMADPSRLMRSATMLYGEHMDLLWGQMTPVPAERLTILEGGETLDLGARRIRVAYTPGHAKHHVSYFDERSGTAFVGDTCGVRMPGFQLVRPATPPPEVDLPAWFTSLDLISAWQPQQLGLTHFGLFGDPARHLAEHRERLAAWAEAVRAALVAGLDDAAIVAAVQARAIAELGAVSPADVALHRQASPPEQSCAGLIRYWRKVLETPSA